MNSELVARLCIMGCVLILLFSCGKHLLQKDVEEIYRGSIYWYGGKCYHETQNMIEVINVRRTECK